MVICLPYHIKYSVITGILPEINLALIGSLWSLQGFA